MSKGSPAVKHSEANWPVKKSIRLVKAGIEAELDAENRRSVGECPYHFDHDTHWVEDRHGYCRNCGAEFIDE